MSFWELLALVGVMATILGISLTVYALINNRTLKEEARGIREILRGQGEILNRIEQGQTEARKEMAEAIKYLAQLIVSESEKTRQAIRGMQVQS